MNFKNLYFIILFLSILSCKNDESDSISFYHWKSNLKLTETQDSIFSKYDIKNLYLHYFDVDILDGGIYPKYVLNSVDNIIPSHNIIPVVFITNRAIKSSYDIDNLSEKIDKLINQISKNKFKNIPNKVQIDCDWNSSTKEKYFKLLKKLNEKYEVSTTIRLHQIKYKDKTGVPPVNEGVLMLYNMGDLKDDTQNSILESKIVSQYINKNSSYPLKLKIALPLFSQSILKNNDGKYRILNNKRKEDFEKYNNIFERVNDNIFTVKKDTLYNGFYLAPGYRIKVEELTENEIIDSYKIIKNSKLKTKDVIFYHLDEDVLTNINFNKIITAL